MANPFYSELRRVSFPYGYWNLRVADADDHYLFQSTAVGPYLGLSEHEILVAGTAIPTEDIAPSSLDIKVMKRFDIEPETVGLTKRFSISKRDLSTDVTIPISLHYDGFPKFPYDHYFRDFSAVLTPTPENMVRTNRISHDLMFNFKGVTQANHVHQVFTEYLPDVPAASARIFDWGVGCGRCSRFVSEFFGADNTYGADIDPVNMDWMHTNIEPKENYKLITTHPHLPYEDAYFDMFYAFSVLTHLDEADSMLWLEELSRVLKPDGIGLVSIHGLANFFSTVNDGTRLHALLTNGFYDLGANPDLNKGFAEITESAKYRDVFQSYSYLAREWAHIFKVEKILPSLSTSGQDYVILRKRSKPSAAWMARKREAEIVTLSPSARRDAEPATETAESEPDVVRRHGT